MIPGEIIPADEPVTVNEGLTRTTIPITNTGAMPVHLTAHYHVFEANPRLLFNRRLAWGMRPDVPATGAIRIDPGATIDVPLVPFGGARMVQGFNGAVDACLDDVELEVALRYLIDRGFLHAEQQ